MVIFRPVKNDGVFLRKFVYLLLPNAQMAEEILMKLLWRPTAWIYA